MANQNQDTSLILDLTNVKWEWLEKALKPLENIQEP